MEAARAGEHGRGFAVVASEVRKLAERSKVAADEIVSLSKNGVEITEQAGNKLSAIVPEIEKTARLVQEIAAASIEQNAGSEQVNSAIQSLNQVTQENAASAEEMATSSEELSSQADQLKELIAYFNVGHITKAKHSHTLAQPTPVQTQQQSMATVKRTQQIPRSNGDAEGKAKDVKGLNLDMEKAEQGYENF